MSSICDNCDCADKSQCVGTKDKLGFCRKKGNEYGVVMVGSETGYAAEIMEFSAAAENNGKCKCGPNCTCTDCNCGD